MTKKELRDYRRRVPKFSDGFRGYRKGTWASNGSYVTIKDYPYCSVFISKVINNFREYRDRALVWNGLIDVRNHHLLH